MATEDKREQAKPNGAQEQQPQRADSTESSDVALDAPNVSVEEITLTAEQLSARVSLDAGVAEKLVRIRAGVDVDLDKVELQIKGVQAESHLRVKLDNIERVVREALAVVRENAALAEVLMGPEEKAADQVAEKSQTSAARSLAEEAGELFGDANASGRVTRIRKTSKLAAQRVKHGFSRAVSALPKLRRGGDSEDEQPESQSNGTAHARTDAETGRPSALR